MMTKSMIETVSGLYIDVADPTPEQISIRDISWALSRQPRFGGHTITENPYSVAEHSVAVSILIEELFSQTERGIELRKSFEENFEGSIRADLEPHEETFLPLFGLLHDASEAYLMDLPSPVKNIPGLREAYLAVESKMMQVIYNHYTGYQPSEGAKKIIHWADVYARSIEAYHFMPSRARDWQPGNRYEIPIQELQNFKAPMKASLANKLFLERYFDLTA